MGTSDQVREVSRSFMMMEDEGTMVVSSLQPSVTLTRKEREKERERRGRGEEREGRGRGEEREGRGRGCCIAHHYSYIGTAFQ